MTEMTQKPVSALVLQGVDGSCYTLLSSPQIIQQRHLFLVNTDTDEKTQKDEKVLSGDHRVCVKKVTCAFCIFIINVKFYSCLQAIDFFGVQS